MPGTQIFSSTNNYYTIVGGELSHRSGGVDNGTVMGIRQYGICMVITALWAKNMLVGLMAKPDAFRAELIQAKCRIFFHKEGNTKTVEQFFDEVFVSTGVKGQKVLDSVEAFRCLDNMLSSPGLYWVWNGPHVIGFKVGAGTLFFYDCDENGAGGLWKFDKFFDWKKKVFEVYPKDESWSVWKITL